MGHYPFEQETANFIKPLLPSNEAKILSSKESVLRKVAKKKHVVIYILTVCLIEFDDCYSE